MKKYIKVHEDYILSQLEQKQITQPVLSYHQIQISHLKHERLVHLIVMTFIGLLAIISLFYTLDHLKLYPTLLSITLLVLEVFYVGHYYILENTVQRWYKIENTLIQALNGVGTNLYP